MSDTTDSNQILQLARLMTQGVVNSTGNTWTYASRLGDMLALAEEMYGERDYSYTLLGIEFEVNGPQIWYPGNRKHIIIQLGLTCLTDMNRGCYQLAHECIHLLSPTGTRKANVLEEGLATYFSAWYMHQHMNAPNWHSAMPSYTRAEALVRQLLAIDTGAIKTLRSIQPSMSEISAALILEHYPTLPKTVAEELCQRFDRD